MGGKGSKSGKSPAALDGGSEEPHVEDGSHIGSEAAREAAAVIDAIDLDQRWSSKSASPHHPTQA